MINALFSLSVTSHNRGRNDESVTPVSKVKSMLACKSFRAQNSMQSLEVRSKFFTKDEVYFFRAISEKVFFFPFFSVLGDSFMSRTISET